MGHLYQRTVAAMDDLFDSAPRQRRWLSQCLLGWALACGAPSGEARAAPAPPSPERAAAGRDRAAEGRAAFDRGDFEGAIRLFRAADAIDPRPAYRYSVAIAQEAAGVVLDARATLIALGDYPPAQERLASVEARVLAEIPPVRLIGLPEGAQVTVDARKMPPHGHLAVGRYTLSIGHPSIYPYTGSLTIVGGADNVVEPPLARRSTHGAVRLLISAPGWRLQIGDDALASPIDAEVVRPAGEVHIAIETPTARGERIVPITPGQTMIVEGPVEQTSTAERAGYWLLGSGGALAAAGAGLSLWAQSLEADAAAELACARDPGDTCTLNDVRAIEDRAVRAEALAWTSLGLGAAALASGWVLIALDDTLPIRVGPTGGGVVLSGAF